jgi:hypothetical protein
MHPMRLVFRSWAVAALMSVMLAGVGGVAYAQETAVNGAVFGTITDETGAALPGVTIEATSPALQGGQSAVSDGQGAYRLSQLPAGVYRITYSISGFRTDIRSNFTLAVGFNARVDVMLKLGAVEQMIEVSGQSPIVDVSTAVVSNTFTRANLDSVPTSRSIFAAVYLAPGVRPTNTPDVGGSQLGNQQAMGAYGYSGNMVPLVDGINVLQSNSLNGGSSPGDFVDYDSLTELKVVSTAADADSGPPGTVMIAVIKTAATTTMATAAPWVNGRGFKPPISPTRFPAARASTGFRASLISSVISAARSSRTSCGSTGRLTSRRRTRR